MITLDELVLNMRDIAELAVILQNEDDKKLVREEYLLLKKIIKKFYRRCYYADYEVLNESLFYAKTLLFNAYFDNEEVRKIIEELILYIYAVIGDLYPTKPIMLDSQEQVSKIK